MRILYASAFKSKEMIAVLPLFLLYRSGAVSTWWTIEIAWLKYWANIKIEVKIKKK